jgi:hypothetical protein
MMVSSKLFEMEEKLDALIANATLLNECEEEGGKSQDLEQAQEKLLNELLLLNYSLDPLEKQLMLRRTPRLYAHLSNKIANLSKLNSRCIRVRHDRICQEPRIRRRPWGFDLLRN